MLQVKLNDTTLDVGMVDSMRTALDNIAKGNAMCSEGKKLADKGKEYLSGKLMELRGIEVGKLPIGELVAVSLNGAPLFNVVIGKQNRLDLDALQVEQPDIAAKYKRDFPTISYKRAV